MFFSSLNFQTTSKWTENILFWKEYKETLLACNWLMTQAAWHVTRTDVTHDQIITPQQVQPSLFPLFILILLQLVFLLHIKNICIGGPSLSFGALPFSLSTPLIYSHRSTRSLYAFLFLWRKREVLIVNRCQCPKKRTAYFLIQAARFTKAYFYYEKPTWNETAMLGCWSNLL